MHPPSLKDIQVIVVAAALAVLMLVGAISYGIVHKVNNGDDIVAIARSSADQADRQSNEIAALRKQLDVQAAGFRHQLAVNGQQAHHVAAVQRFQNNILIRALRRAGIPVPKAALLSNGGGGAAPKGPTASRRHHSPGTRPTTDTSPNPSPLLCQILPAVCDGLLLLPPISQ